MTYRLSLLCLLILPVLVKAGKTPAPKVLFTPEQILVLDSMIRMLPDPVKKEYVKLNIVKRTAWGSEIVVKRTGWYEKKSGLVSFADGSVKQITASDTLDFIDFNAYYSDIFSKSEAEDHFSRMMETSIGNNPENIISIAAWAYKLKYFDLTDKALKQLNTYLSLNEQFKWACNELAWNLFADMMHAYLVKADSEALFSAKLLLKKFPDTEYTEQTNNLIQELERRKAEGTFNIKSDSLPPDFSHWDVQKQITYMVGILDDEEARQLYQPGGVNFYDDWRVKQIVIIGEPAVNTLIDLIENDTRLTRSIHFHRDFKQSRSVISVSEVALSIAMSIMQVSAFRPMASGDNFSYREPMTKKQKALYLRNYWSKYSNTPYDERMMSVLKDDQSSVEEKQHAAYNLVHINSRTFIGTTVLSSSLITHNENPTTNPVISKFSSPTVAEAILKLMDEELLLNEKDKRDNLYNYEKKQIYYRYIDLLITLKDQRAEPIVYEKYKVSSNDTKLKLAFLCHKLGNSKPINDYAVQVKNGEINIPANTGEDDEPGSISLSEIANMLGNVATPECKSALGAIGNPMHPYHALWEDRIKRLDDNQWMGGSVWFSQPFCIDILKKLLLDHTQTKDVYASESASLDQTTNSIHSVDSTKWRKYAMVKSRRTEVCDHAAVKLHSITLGLPEYNPLMVKRDSLLKYYEEFTGRYHNYLECSDSTLKGLGIDYLTFDIMFYPDIKLDIPASQEDYTQGKALFYLHGNSVRAVKDHPKIIEMTDADGSHYKGLILQAEKDKEGMIHYGIISTKGVQVLKVKP